MITSRAFHEAMLIPPNRHKRAIIPDSLLPNIRKKQLTQEMTLEPAAERCWEVEGGLKGRQVKETLRDRR